MTKKETTDEKDEEAKVQIRKVKKEWKRKN